MKCTPLGKQLSWTYDAVGNMKTKTGYEGDVTTFQYDSSNRLVAMSNPEFLQVSYHYDPAGRLLNRILSNGAQTNYRYDDDGRLTRLTNLSANKTVVEDLNYEHDQLGNITSITNATTGRDVSYGYDAAYRLTNVDGNNDLDGSLVSDLGVVIDGVHSDINTTVNFFGDVYDATQQPWAQGRYPDPDFQAMSQQSGANGGYVIYPSKVNSSFQSVVYSK